MTHLVRKWRKANFEEHPLNDKITCQTCGWRIELNESHIMTNYEQTKNAFNYYHKWCWQKHA